MYRAVFFLVFFGLDCNGESDALFCAHHWQTSSNKTCDIMPYAVCTNVSPIPSPLSNLAKPTFIGNTVYFLEL